MASCVPPEPTLYLSRSTAACSLRSSPLRRLQTAAAGPKAGVFRMNAARMPHECERQAESETARQGMLPASQMKPG
jgi:hypothetical protein